jgi:(p)ppGpp synthase/HD superfamily hydrolase
MSIYLSIACLVKGVVVFPEWRRKKENSILYNHKVRNQNIEDHNDLNGIRLISHTASNCYKVLNIVHKILPVYFFWDNIVMPRGSGYQNLSAYPDPEKHIEIQIVSREMKNNNELLRESYHEGGIIN